ncbi:MAG TPA: O-antigen ligase family protein [Longimicrobium sp.]|nr:O-antigen ligase family protein [Longimicrobium sp.]
MHARPAPAPLAAAGPRAARRDLPLLYLAAGLPLVTAGLANLPAGWRAGPVSVMGAQTIAQSALALAGAVAVARWPRRVAARAVPFALFLAWAVVRSLLAPPTFEGAQNALVYLFFFAGLVLAGSLAAHDPPRAARWLARGVEWMLGMGLAVAVVNLAAFGVPRHGSWLVGPRSLSLVILIGVNWQLARWAAGHAAALPLALLGLAAVLGSASRAASAIGLLAVAAVVALLAPSRPRRAAAGLLALALGLGAGAALVAFAPPFHARFFGGDTRLHVAGYAVNVSGRAAFWRVMARSAGEAPLVGHGLGSSQAVMAAEFLESDNIRHPHNDYLRLWHDLGAVGLSLLLVSLLGWARACWRGWRLGVWAGHPPRAVQLAALLTLGEILLAMVTDNVLIYPFFMGAAGVLVGAALGFDASLRTALAAGRHDRRDR